MNFIFKSENISDNMMFTYRNRHKQCHIQSMGSSIRRTDNIREVRKTDWFEIQFSYELKG